MSDEQEVMGVFETAKAEARKQYAKFDLHSLVLAMKGTAEQKQKLEDDLKVVNAHYDVLRFEAIPARMEEDGVENIRYEGIGRVSLTADVNVSTKADSKDALFEWMRKHKLGSLIQEGVNSSTLKAFVKGRIKEGKEYPSELLNVMPITRASITKA